MATHKNLHLIISVVFVFIIALAYGLFPNNILPKLFDFKVESNDLKQVFRASMGLYTGMVLLWTIGIFKPIFWATATIANVFFMSGLALGRITSLVVDGLPSIYFSIWLTFELILAFWGLRNLKLYPRTMV